MSLVRRNKNLYLKQVGLYASFREAKRMYENKEISKEEYIKHLKGILKEYEKLKQSELDSEFIELVQMIISK
ncbi:MAG: hypothetical protein AAFP76_10365 [Bacteroidota bacterium]